MGVKPFVVNAAVCCETLNEIYNYRVFHVDIHVPRVASSYVLTFLQYRKHFNVTYYRPLYLEIHL